MAQESEKRPSAQPQGPPAQGSLPLGANSPEDQETPRANAGEGDRSGGGFLGRMNQRFQDVLHTSRGASGVRAPENQEPQPAPARHVPVEEPAPARRPKTGKSSDKMNIPEDAIIDGSITSSSETEIAGKVTGDVKVEGRLQLAQSAVVSGNVKAARCRIEGTVEGNVECSQDLELGQNGHLKAQVVGGNRITVAGQIAGNVRCGGLLRLVASARVTGDVKTRKIVVEEGATFNGRCYMRSSTGQTGKEEVKESSRSSK